MLRFQFWFNMICLHVYSRVDRMIKTCSKYKKIFKKNSGYSLLKSFFIIISKMINKFSCYITIIMLFSSIINQMKQKLILMILLKL